MRLRLLRPALALAVTCAPTGALLAQRYDSMSAGEVQRRLERDTDALVNELRSRRNTPLSTPSFDVHNSTWAQELRAREERKKAARDAWLEQQRLDAQWRRDHPGETREQYYERTNRETAARKAARLQRLANQSAAQIEQFIALQNARLEQVQWAEVRRAAHGYASRERPPVFKTGQEAADWLTAHDRHQPNQWAAVQAALLLIDGVNGVKRDPAAAARLVDPRSQRSRPDDDPIRPDSLALHAYLRATHPELHATDNTPAAVAEARRDLEKIADTSDLAKWLLARLLAESADPADQERALVHLGAGYEWASGNYEHFFGYQTPSAKSVQQHLDRTLIATLQRHQVHLAQSLQSWPQKAFQGVARLLASTKPAPADLLGAYTDAIAERRTPRCRHPRRLVRLLQLWRNHRRRRPRRFRQRPRPRHARSLQAPRNRHVVRDVSAAVSPAGGHEPRDSRAHPLGRP